MFVSSSKAAMPAAQRLVHEPDWLRRVHIVAIFGSFAVSVLALLTYLSFEQTQPVLRMTLSSFGFTGLMIGVRAMVRNGSVTRASLLMHVGLFLFSCAMAVFDRSGWRILLFVPWAAVAVSHIQLHQAQVRFLPTILWCTAALVLTFTEKLGLVPGSPWVAGIGWINMFANAIGVMFSLSWRYNMSVAQLTKATDANRLLKAANADLESMVEASTEDLIERELRFRTVSELTSDYAFGWTITRDQRIISEWSTEAIVLVTGYTREEFESNWRKIVHPEDHEIYEKRLLRTLANETNEAEFRIFYKGGDEIRWLHAKTRPIWSDKEKRVVKAVGAIVNITERRDKEDRIEQLAYYDALTGFGNRSVWKAWTNTALLRARVSESNLCILYLDLDRFKAVNDTLGHDVGDGLLKEVSKRMFSCIGANDRLARLGGDEFAILLLDAQEQHAMDVARCVQSQFVAPFSVRGHTIQSRCSIGIACFPRDGATISQLQQNAEIAMYRAKTRTDRIQVYSPDISMFMDEQVQLEAELGAAIEREQFVLYFQPILDLNSGTIVKAEVLMRWQHPTRGFVSPGVFIPLAEESGMIVDIDRWVIQASFDQVSRWRQQGIDAAVSINVSALTLRDGDFLNYVRDALSHYGTPPENITFEITESAAIEDPEATSRVLHSLRHMGFMLAMDDFGRGYTSIVFLKDLPVHYVKIDKSFVDGIGRDAKDEGVLRAVLALAKGLEILTVAEGVEHGHQLEWLAAHGCDFVQGWHIGKAVPPADYLLQRDAPPVRNTLPVKR
jgi:diguanylate cyclase (GGDEF)-like protein/PAS domain S-box-containing protein